MTYACRALPLVSLALVSLSLSAQVKYSITDETAAGSGTPMVVVLHDVAAGAEAAVAPSEGGELSSYRVTVNGKQIEMLYHARDYAQGPGFKGKGPVLWPAVGPQYPAGTIPKESCGNGTYQIAGEAYPMPCHGFARNLPWKEVGRSATDDGAQVTVQLSDSEQSRVYYPFAYTVDCTYLLHDGQLTVTYTVHSDSTNNDPMPFAIANHIAFRLPFVEGTDPAAMTFESNGTTQLLRNPSGAGLNGEEKPRSFARGERLGDFDARVALPLSGYKSMPYALLTDPQGVSLRLSQRSSTELPGQVIRFNVYGGPKDGYLCPEPWFGLMNSLNQKDGHLTLQPGQSWQYRFLLQPSGKAPEKKRASPGVEKVAGGFGYVEGPVWSLDGHLLFSDMISSRILKLTAPNKTEIYRDFTNEANGNSADAQGRLYSAEKDGRRISRMEPDGSIRVLAELYQGKRLNDPNDVTVSRDGEVYFTDPTTRDLLEPLAMDYAGVYHLDRFGAVTLVSKMKRPNGLTLTPDGKHLLVADTQERRIYTFDLDATGNTSNGRVLIDGIDGGPDGLRVAANGNIYIACRGVAVYSPQGNLLHMIEFPETPANLTFGDADLKTIYVTARTSIYKVRVPDAGFSIYR